MMIELPLNKMIVKERFFIKKVIDIRYKDIHKELQNKQITIDTKIVPQDQYQNIDKLREILECEVFVIYDNNNYANNYYKNKYKTIIESHINKENLIYVTQYCYLDSHQL